MKNSTNKNIELAVRQLLTEGKAGTHEDICSALEKQGFSVNQPKISRLLHKIGAIKVTDQDGQNTYRLPHEHGLMHEWNVTSSRVAVMQWILDIDHNENMIVIHTSPGAAAIVAREIDLHHIKLRVLGCIAGDDTIFVAPKSVKEMKRVMEDMTAIFSSAK